MSLWLLPALERADNADNNDSPDADAAASTTPATTEDRRDLIYYPGDTEHVVPLTKKLLGHIWLHQNAIWTSPFHMNKEDAQWWAAFGALTVRAVLTDRRTSHIFENSKGQVNWS